MRRIAADSRAVRLCPRNVARTESERSAYSKCERTRLSVRGASGRSVHALSHAVEDLNGQSAGIGRSLHHQGRHIADQSDKSPLRPETPVASGARTPPTDREICPNYPCNGQHRRASTSGITLDCSAFEILRDSRRNLTPRFALNVPGHQPVTAPQVVRP